MKKFILLITIYCFLIQTSEAQINLVRNYSFEDTISCITGGGQVSKARYWQIVSFTPDYFHTCSPFWQVGIPFNNFGFQWPNTGEAYMGAISYSASTPVYRECIGQQLFSALSIGVKYYVTLKVCLAFSPSTGWNAACNKIGVLLSTTNYLNDSNIINNWCQVSSDSIIKDSINWVTVRGSFIADSAYSFITIGNLFSNANTDTINLSPSNTHQVYYYLDDVCLSTDSLFCESLTVLPEVIHNTKLGIYPSPAKDKIHIENLPSSTVSIEIINVNGIIIKKIYPIGRKNLVEDISIYQEGIYILKFNYEYSENTVKFIKSNY